MKTGKSRVWFYRHLSPLGLLWVGAARAAIFFGLILRGLTVAAANFNPYEGPKPIAVFIYQETPLVAIYEDGEAIFVKPAGGKRGERHHVTFDDLALAALREMTSKVTRLAALKSFYDLAPLTTDQTTSKFYIRDGEREIAITVRGLDYRGVRTPGARNFGELPNELLQLHKWLREFDSPKSVEWKPKYMEVMLWRSHTTLDLSPPTKWPKEWPSLGSDRAFKRGDVNLIFLDASLREKLADFFPPGKNWETIEIDGAKWETSYDATFPSEQIWQVAFEQGVKTWYSDGRHAEFESSLKMFRELAAADPKYLSMVDLVLEQSGDLYRDENRKVEARAAFEEAAKIYNDFAKNDPARYSAEAKRVQALIEGLKP
jgi:hypothetical protein